ncbi:MAG TPA: U32 family peptidase C-terminal domain-containing protein, partial [Candidatus Cloacimonadota bacterium]|nr:U32 family peptidase C-terminal domain-containing protein [Candidatus Cloacimonadota bacterium]
GEYFPIEEGAYGTSILSSKDLCLLDRISAFQQAGISAGKIEGRMKSLYYVAQISRIYKTALHTPSGDLATWQRLHEEVEKVSHRPYWEGFYEVAGAGVTENSSEGDYSRDWQYCGKIIAHQEGKLVFDSLAKVSRGDMVELIYPDLSEDFSLVLDRIYDDENNAVEHTRPNFRYWIPVAKPQPEAGILRKCVTTS